MASSVCDIPKRWELRERRKLAGVGENEFNFGLTKFENHERYSRGYMQKAVGDSSLEFKRRELPGDQ